MPEIITSIHNPRIRNLALLGLKSRERKKQGRIVIEGYREISRALESGFRILELYYVSGMQNELPVAQLLGRSAGTTAVEISAQVFEKLAYRESSDGMLAIASPIVYSLDSLEISKTPLFIVLESVEKPGNLGAVMRTADAAGVDAVIICDPLTDLYNPNTIRASLGCIFSVPLLAASTSEVQAWLSAGGITTYAAALSPRAIDYCSADYRAAVAFVMGTEATGLTESWLNFCDQQVIIPMNGIADSLNVSVSVAILVYEALRQRNSR